jgi:hypothetical protein
MRGWFALLVLVALGLNGVLLLRPVMRPCRRMDFYKLRGAVAFSLYGRGAQDRNDRYWGGAMRNLELFRSAWPDNWEPVVFVPEGTNTSLLFATRNGTAPRVVQVSPKAFGSWRVENVAMFFRFLVADLDYDVFVVRDADSRPLMRDRLAVEEFVGSTYCFHTMHDHPYHSQAVQGGMWGAKRGTFARPMAEMLAQHFRHYPPHAPKGIDQDFLQIVIYQQVRWRSLDHNSVGLFCEWWPVLYGGSKRPFPIKRRATDEFVGSACLSGWTDACSGDSLLSGFNDCGLIQ